MFLPLEKVATAETEGFKTTQECAIPRPKDVIPGFSDLKSYSRGIYENKQTNYTKEENLLFEVRSEVRDLISDLEKSEIKLNEDEA